MRKSLTLRQIQVLQLHADGYSTQEIADILQLSLATIRAHQQAIRNRLHRHSMIAAVADGFRKELVH